MKKEEKEKSIIHAGIAGAGTETVQRYGSAVKEHVVAYTGADHEIGKELSKSLSKISESRINKKYAEQNIAQQAGFAAEVKTVARENAEKIIKGQAPRTTRTDDMQKQSDGKGRTVGGKNEQLYDIAEVNRDGTYIVESGRQLKYVGENAKACYKSLLGKKFDKYREADATIEIPSDFYDGVKKELNEKIQSLEKQIRNAEAKGNSALATKHREQLRRVEKTRDNLRKGKLTKSEAREARLNPVISTAKDMAKISHRAGMESAKYGTAIGGGISIVQNLVAVVKEEKEPNEAILDVAKETGASTAIAYGTGFTGAVVKGFMQNAESQSVRILSKTNLPGIIVTATVNATRTMKKYYGGEISGVECFEELGEQGTGMISSAMFAAVGQAAIPIPVVGGVIGGMVGYAMASASYSTLLDALKEEKWSHEERIRIEQESEQQIQLIRAYRKELERTIEEYFSTNMTIFHDSFAGIKNALCVGDIDGFITSANSMTQALGKDVLFHNVGELDALMDADTIIKF